MKNEKYQFEQISLIKAIIESKSMDTKFYWAKHNYGYKHDKYIDRKKIMQYDKIMKKAETCWLQL